MENGVDGSHVGDLHVEDSVIGDKVEKRVLVGSDDVKDMEDDVFEEAIDSQEYLQEQGPKVVELGGDDNVGEDSGLVVVDDNSNVQPEKEAFEEAIGGPGETGNSVDVADESSQEKVGDNVVEASHEVDEGGIGVDTKADNLNGGEGLSEIGVNVDMQVVMDRVTTGGVEAPDKIDEGGTESVTYETNGIEEVSEVSANGDIDVLKGMDNASAAEVLDETIVGVPEVEAVIYESNGTEEVSEVLANGETEVLKGMEIPDDVEVSDKVDESSTNDAASDEINGGNSVSEVVVNGNMEVLNDEDVADVKPDFVVENPGKHDSLDLNLEATPFDDKLENKSADQVEEVGLVSNREINFNGDVSLEDGKFLESNEILGTEFQNEKPEESVDAAANTHLKLQDNHVELSDSSINIEGSGNSQVVTADLISGSIDDNREDVRGILDVPDNKTVDAEDSLADQPTSLQEDTLTKENGFTPSLENSKIAENKEFLSGEGVSSREVDKISEPSHFDVNVNEVHSKHVMALEPEKEAELNQEKIIAPMITEPKGLLAPSLASSSAKSTNAPQVVKNSEPPRFDVNVNEVHEKHIMAKEPEKKAEIIQEKKATSQMNREPSGLPALVSSPAKSTNANVNAPPAVRPAGLGRAAPLLEPAPRVAQQSRVNGTVSQTQSQQIEDSANGTNGEADENDETREKLQMIRVKFLRLAHRLGQTPHNVVVAQVLYRLGLAEQLRGRNGGRVGAFSFDRASAMAEQLEAAGQEPLDFSCTIMVLGKTGVGKSATINSIFDEVKFSTDAFQTGTKKVQDVVGMVQGIKVRVIDTPGLLPSGSDQRQNEKILHSVKRFITKTPPDIVLYLDRLDMQSRDFGDMPLLRTITEIFGQSIWFNAIVVLTHAASAPPDGPNGTASSYDMFVTQRSHVVQQAIRQAAGDMRLMNPVSLVENHSACRINRAGQRVLPNGQVWKPHLLLLSFASKILAEANALLKLQDSPPGKPFTARSRAPPLPFLLSSLLQPKPQVKLPEEQYDDEDDVDDDLDDSSDSEDESELDQLPPFKRLTKVQMGKLSKAQMKEYLDELEYREKLFMKKQLKEEKKRRKMMKKMEAAAKDLPNEFDENVEEESGGAASVPVAMPDLSLPASFDSDNPTHRYRYLDSSNQWLVRPVLETHGWDHDVGYEGINAERLFVIKEKIPLSFSGQVTKDKKDANVQMELASSIKHGEGKATSIGMDMQTVGKDLAYTLRSETRFCNFRKNKATAGLSVTLLGDALSAGMKVEDKIIANKRFRLVMTGGAMTGRGEVAYGGSLEAQLRDKDYPLGRFLSTLGLSVMDWHGDLAIGGNIQSQIPIGRSTNLIARANLNNRGAGQVSIRLNSSEQLQIALVGLLPLLRKLFGYPQQMQFAQ